MASDNFQPHDYYLMDELLTDEHKLIRETARAWVKKEVTPIVEEACQTTKFPKQWIKGLAEIGAFGPYIPSRIWWTWFRSNFLRINYARVRTWR